jgi:hypothetical protein
MVAWYWVLITGLVGAVIGLAWPRLCPRCKIERQWVKDAMKFVAKKEEKEKKP